MVKIDVSRRGRYWVMQVCDIDDPSRDYIANDTTGFPAWPPQPNTWMGRIAWCERELKDRPDVRRMSYDQWYWRNRQELDKFLTIHELKFGGESI